MQFYGQHPSNTTPSTSGEYTRSWRLYPIYGIEGGVCTCRKGGSCPTPGKHPMTFNGIKDATSDPQEIAAMFRQRPGCNVGLACGKESGVVVLDADTFEGGAASVKALEGQHGRLPATRMHQSGGGGGLHYLFRYPQHVERLPSRNPLAPGLELKSDGMGVVLPPSMHASGARYEVLIERDLAPLPRWVVDLATGLHLIEGDGGVPQERTESKFALPAVIPEGTRNRTLYRFGSSLRAHGWGHHDILQELREVNAVRCVPPMGDPEVRTIARSAASHEPGHASFGPTPEVLEIVAFLEQKAASRAKSGTAAFSRWAVYRALLAHAAKHGYLHQDQHVGVNISVRQLALLAGLSVPTTRKALKDSSLIRRISPGEGARAGDLALLAPPRRGTPLHTCTTLRDSQERGEATKQRRKEGEAALWQMRHKHTVGKAAGEVLEKIVEAGDDGITRAALAENLRKSPETLKKQLKKLLDLGLVERPKKGTYRVVEDWEKVLERERVMSGERKSERLDEAQYQRDRLGYAEWRAGREQEGRDG